MRRFEKGKEFVSLNDVLFIDKNVTDKIPESLYGKLLILDVTVIGKNEELFIEVTTKEEKEFIHNIMCIYNKNYLDMLSITQLKEEVDILKQQIGKMSNTEDFSKETKELKYKFNSLLDYLNERVVECCDTCENEKCEVEASKKIGLNEDGHPMGYECPNYINKFKKLKKYTLN